MDRSLALFTLIAALGTGPVGCGGGGMAEVTGTVGGYSLNANSWYWGGPFLVLASRDYDCIDMSWVKRTWVGGDEAPVSADVTALQFTYNEGDVVTGTYSVEGAAPVKADLLVVEAGALQVFDARTGALVLEDLEDEGIATGSFDLGFDDGTLSGSFEAEYCNNLKTKD